MAKERDPAWHLVVRELTSLGAELFAPLAESSADLVARVNQGHFVELRLARMPTPNALEARVRRPRPSLFVLGVVSTDPAEAWVLPSGAFDRFSDGGVLALDEPADEPMRERLAIYRNRWSLIADFDKFRATLNDPVALQVLLAWG